MGRSSGRYSSTIRRADAEGEVSRRLHIVGMPLMEICNATYTTAPAALSEHHLRRRARGALAHRHRRSREAGGASSTKGKEKLLEPTSRRCTSATNYAVASLPPVGLAVKRSDRVGNRVFLEGNTPAALGCVYGGRRSPRGIRSRRPRRWRRRSQALPTVRTDPASGKARYAIVRPRRARLHRRGYRAAWNGARPFTCTSRRTSAHEGFRGSRYFAEIRGADHHADGRPTRPRLHDR